MTHRDKAIATLHQHDRNNVSTYYARFENNRVVSMVNTYCHAAIFREPQQFCEYATNCQAAYDDSESIKAARNLVDWILVDNSCWYPVVNSGFERIEVNEELVGVYFPNLIDVPIQLVRNISAALRYAGADNHSSALVWNDLVKLGVHPAAAFVASHQLVKKRGVYVRHRGFNWNHSCFDRSVSIDRFMRRDFRICKNNNLSTAIWSESDQKIIEQNIEAYSIRKFQTEIIKTKFSSVYSFPLEKYANNLVENGYGA